MKKHILKLLALALCAVSLLNLTALAEEAVSPEEADTEKTTAEDELPAAPAAVLYWGTVTTLTAIPARSLSGCRREPPSWTASPASP